MGREAGRRTLDPKLEYAKNCHLEDNNKIFLGWGGLNVQVADVSENAKILTIGKQHLDISVRGAGSHTVDAATE